MIIVPHLVGLERVETIETNYPTQMTKSKSTQHRKRKAVDRPSLLGDNVCRKLKYS